MKLTEQERERLSDAAMNGGSAGWFAEIEAILTERFAQWDRIAELFNEDDV